MSNGKFYEMIPSEVEDGIGNTTGPDMHWIAYIDFYDLKRFLDEAKAEFPYRNIKSMDDLLKLSRDRHIWFIRWFGSRAEELPDED